ncbi:hypothetical protein IFM47457_01062 [Aspergillus lentulus]|nr:hypothetical protein IFM47457_01062 [Aspergillus lentulus]
MKILPSFLRLLGNLLAVSLLACLFVTAFNLDFLPRGLSTRLFGRSLPGSLVTAPQGAVGHQPPPGPVANDARPTEAMAYKTITTTIITRETTHELRQAPAAMRNSSALHGLSNNVVVVTGTVTRTRVMVVPTQTASSEGSRAATGWGLATLASSVLWALWHL